MAAPRLALLPLAALAFAFAPPASAETVLSCTGYIFAAPATITTQGTWCLGNDISATIASGAAITLNGSNIALDCNGHKIGGMNAGPGTQASGILAVARTNISVRGCTIRGFRTGIEVVGATGSGHLIEGNRLDGNTQHAIIVEGDGVLVRDNIVTDTGGSTLAGETRAIVLNGQGDIQDNRISGVVPIGSDPAGPVIAIGGILGDSTVTGNVVRGLLARGSGLAAGYDGRFVTGTVIVRENRFFGPRTGLAAAAFCVGAAFDSSLSQNTISGFTVDSFAFCADDGGNIVKP